MDAVSEWFQPYLEAQYPDAAVRAGDLDQLVRIAATYPSCERFLTELTLDLPEATSDEAGAPLLDEDYLILSTIHSAKGQEWDAVYLLCVADGSGHGLLPGAVWYEDALASSSPARPDAQRMGGDWSPDDLYILYTGGTTCTPGRAPHHTLPKLSQRMPSADEGEPSGDFSTAKVRPLRNLLPSTSYTFICPESAR